MWKSKMIWAPNRKSANKRARVQNENVHSYIACVCDALCSFAVYTTHRETTLFSSVCVARALLYTFSKENVCTVAVASGSDTKNLASTIKI